MRWRGALAWTVLVLSAARPLAAQDDYVLPLEWRWYINAATGFSVFTGATFNAIDASLQAGGWFTLSGQCGGRSGCRGPAGYAEDKHMPLSIAVRRSFNERTALRLSGSLVRPGTLSAQYVNYRIAVTPASTVVAAQALLAFGAAWIGAGPLLDFARVTSGTAAAPVTTTETKPGLAIGAGFTFPRHKPLWLEVVAEGRLIGSIAVPLIPVPAARDIPAMDIPLSHMILTIGVGWRFP